jgi:HAD superfamily hydrolase (TIGR01509 family)
LNAGAYEILNNLKGKVSLALASMNNKEVVRKHLETCQIASFFDVVLSADEVHEPKPNPEIFLKCSAKLGIDVSECVVIEDSILGIKAAKKAKMKCIAVTTGISSSSQIEKEYPNLIVSSLIEKTPILNFILKR